METILSDFIPQFYNENINHSVPKTIYVSDMVNDLELIEQAYNTRLHIPKGGFGKKVMQRAMENAESALMRHKKNFAESHYRITGNNRSVGIG